MFTTFIDRKTVLIVILNAKDRQRGKIVFSLVPSTIKRAHFAGKKSLIHLL